MATQSRNHDTWSEVEDFCYALGGKKPIHSILIANNGMAAAKFIRSVRTWALETFGTEKAILLVAMATPEDLMINAEHVRIADQFVQVPGGTNNNNYANVHLIVETAEMTHVDAVWPGWGHASENPELPETLSAKGIIFLGPPASSMAALGDKVGSSLIAQAVGIPTLPWSGSHVKIPHDCSLLEPIPDNVYRQACVYTTEEALASCRLVGYPAMIKASWGGGGKGIRKVHNDDEVESAFKQVQGEVHGSPIFIMKVASESRHLEVQLLCDQYGNVAALHSRDCSVQRRHQKIIEEGPITVAPLKTVKELEQAARRLAKCVNYVGAATVEYLYSMDTTDSFFLELNPRLQVEHPITEWIAEINLPAAQVSVAMGIPLWQIPEIRRFYGMDHNGGYDAWMKTSIVATPFDFDKAESVRTRGHCVAVRITCEDPDHGFKPTGGKVQELSFKSKPNVWAYFSIKSGGGIHQFSDSQFGHIFAFGKSRALATANMVLGLKEIHIKGEIHTNVNYVLDLLYASEYKNNQIHTDWLDRRIAMRVRAERPPWYLSVVGGALYKVITHSTTMVSDYVAYLEKGQILPKQIALVHSQISLNVEGRKYTIDMVRRAPQSYTLRMNQSEIFAETHTLSDGGLLMQLDGNSHVINAEEVAAGTRLSIDGRTCLLQNDHDPSQLVVETPCKLLRFLVSDGSHLIADTPYAEIEVMKMHMPLLLPASGAIHFKITEGQAMQTGDLIARLDLDDPSAIRKAEPFQGSFPLLGSPTAVSVKVHQRFAASLNAARMILAGYEHNVDKVMQDLIDCMDSSELPFLQWQESMAVLATRLPKDLKDELNMKFKGYEGISNSHRNVEFPAKLLQGVLMAHLSSCPHKDKTIQERLLDPLMTLVKSYEGGLETHAHVVVQFLFEEYLSTEEIFSAFSQADMIEHLRLQPKKDLHKVVDIVLSHQSVHKKNKLILRLMKAMVYPNPAAYRDKLIRFSSLNHRSHSELALKASQLVEQIKLSELRCSTARSLSEVETFTEEGEHVDTATRKSSVDEMMKDLVRAPLPVEDVLVGLFDNTNRMLQMRVVETYIRRLYQCYLVKGSIQMQWHESGLIAYWKFSEEHIETRNKLNDESFGKPIVDKHRERKWGAMVIVKTLQLLPMVVCAALHETSQSSESNMSNPSVKPVGHGNVLHIALVGMNSQISVFQDSGNEDDIQENINKLVMLLEEKQVGSALCSAGVGVISFIIQSDELSPPVRHSFHWSLANLSYEEAPLYRHLEPPLSSFLELEKFKAFENIQYSPSLDRQWHMYTVVDKRQPIQRMFLRTLVRQYKTSEDLSSYQGEDSRTVPALSRCILRSLIAGLEELDLHGKSKIVRADYLHMYLCLVCEQQIDDLVSYPRKVDTMVGQEEYTVGKILEELAHKIHELVGVRMYRLGVSEWEVKFWMASAGLASGVWRIVISDVTVHTCTVHTYREVEGPDNKVVYHSVFNELGPLHGVSVTAHYKPLGVIEQKRLLSRKKNTTYCYDFPLAFQMGLQRSWKSLYSSTPSTHKPKDKYLLKVRELIFANKEGCWDTPLVSVERPPALNDVGMVAWCMDMSTPEFPNGRTVFVIANDITFRSGSFGPKEYSFFCAVSNLACSKKLPLIYLAANSGVHVEVAEEVKSCFRVAWSDESIPERGFQYLYLTPEDHKRLGPASIGHEIKLETGETRWVIDAIIGGGENLTGTGAVAGAYLRAYKETFTLTYVTGPTVGIGAYLARFGMRCIQRHDQPIVLTGFAALNKLLGRPVYTSHMQLGGPKIMTTNGVVHLTVDDDLEGISAILNWLSYVPPYVGGPLPILNPLDPSGRLVKYFPEKSCDPRAAICGVQDSKGAWLGGIFDKDSFVETLGGWAQTVVTGRAKLGGIPIGIIAAETKTVMQVIPADPAQLDSHERLVPQAGQLWFPDSATKTSQAILDFNREELPLFVMANWRGFSGGQKDLFEGILQAGSAILENLRTYKQPVFMYIPMMGELRGGAWVVADSKNNPEHIEIYGETTSKGNVLEPEGLIEIKFRTKELLECMGRLDLQLVSLKGALQEARESGDKLTFEALQEKIRSREKGLLPIYTRIATRFAELHETSTSLVATGVIKEVIDWENSRSFFYRRLRRKLSEGSLMRVIIETAGDQLSHKSAMELIKKWFLASKSVQDGEDTWLDDEDFFAWKDDPTNYEEYLQEIKVQNVLFHLSRIGESSSGLLALLQGLPALLSKVEASRLEQFIEELRKVLSR